jgi:hypothetical protein
MVRALPRLLYSRLFSVRFPLSRHQHLPRPLLRKSPQLPIQVSQVVCIVEAMKLMNEIESEVAGRVVEILAENAQPVEFGQTLFLIDPE